MLPPDVSALAAVWQRRTLATLWRMGVPARAGALRRSAAAVTLTVVPNRPESMPAILRASTALQAALGTRRAITVRQSGRLALIDVPLPSGMARAPTLASIPPGSGLAVPLGRGHDGRPVVVDLANPATCHGLVTGATGSGKSNALRLMLRQLAIGAPSGLQVVLCDPDGRTFTGLGPVAVDPAEVRQALCWTAAEVELRAGDTGVISLSPVVVFVDEVQAALQVDGARAALETITARGRKHAVHAILATSDPSAAAVPRSIANNLRFRLAFAVADYHASMGAIGQAGAERLGQPGQAIFQPGGRRLTVAFAGPADLASVVNSPAIVAPWVAVGAVPEGVPEVPAGVPADGWRWLWGCFRDSGAAPGVGRIAARFKVGKARAAELQALVRMADIEQDQGKTRAKTAPIPMPVPEVRA